MICLTSGARGGTTTPTVDGDRHLYQYGTKRSPQDRQLRRMWRRWIPYDDYRGYDPLGGMGRGFATSSKAWNRVWNKRAYKRWPVLLQAGRSTTSTR